MSDKWEVVGAPKKRPVKPKPPPIGGEGNGQIVGQQVSAKPVKAKKHSRKVPAAFPLNEDEDAVDSAVAADLGLNGSAGGKKPPKSDNKSQKKSSQQQPVKPKEKRRDLEAALKSISPSELLDFFGELQRSGAVEEICLSWIKYTADALNTKLNVNVVIPPDQSQFPLDLNYPRLPSELQEAIRSIITQSSRSRKDLTDVLGVSYSSLLAVIPNLVQRGDPGWGYLIILREICRIDPSVVVRRGKTFSDLMESYGNRKEIGLDLLWAVAQAGFDDSPYVLKIASSYLLPYYGFRNYKQFVLAAIEATTAASVMAPEPLIDIDEFEEFFESAFDPKKKRDLEKIYPRVKELVLRGINKRGGQLFLRFVAKISDKEFSSASPYGREVFEILLGCLENDSGCVDVWRTNVSKYPKESGIFLSYLAKRASSIKCSKAIESKFIQSDEFAVACVKNPELLRMAKKVQSGIKQAEASRRWFSWKKGCLLLLLVVTGLFWLDVSENGKGSFEKSNTGRLLKTYGVLEEAMVIVKAVTVFAKYAFETASVLFRSLYDSIRPVLQTVGDQVQVYIPQFTEYCKSFGNFCVEFLANASKFLEENVFVGALSKENLRKLVKDSLAFVWGYIVFLGEKLFELIEKYIK